MTNKPLSAGRFAAAALAAGGVALLAIGLATAWAGGTSSTTEAARATAKFHNLAVAKHAGYGLLKDKNGIACIAMDSMPGMGAMGIHYANSALVGDGKLNVKTPEALVYAPQTRGTPQLAALEYVVLKSAWDAHHSTPPSLFGTGFNLTPAGNRFGLPAFYSLHVWLWQHNPSGLFSMWNPRVSCR
jgi:hypothetical protein